VRLLIFTQTSVKFKHSTDWLRNRIAVPGYIYLTNIPDYHLEDLLNHEMFACFSIASSRVAFGILAIKRKSMRLKGIEVFQEDKLELASQISLHIKAQEWIMAQWAFEYPLIYFFPSLCRLFRGVQAMKRWTVTSATADDLFYCGYL